MERIYHHHFLHNIKELKDTVSARSISYCTMVSAHHILQEKGEKAKVFNPLSHRLQEVPFPVLLDTMGADINAIQELSDILLLGQARPRAPPPQFVKLKLLAALRICSKPSTTNRITQAKSLKTKKPAQLFASARKQVFLYHF